MVAQSTTQERVLELLRRHGRDAVSFQILEPGLHYWFDGDACVAYAEVAGGRAWVAAGGPVAARDREHEVMVRFADAARAAGRRVRFFGIERGRPAASAFEALDVGAQFVWDPRQWSATLAGRRSLREQLRRARAKQVVVRLADPEAEPGLRARVDALIAHWLATRAMAPMGFVVSIAPWDHPAERRFFVAERGEAGELVGILVAVPIYARGGYLLEDVLRDPSAPNGTVELMFDAAMRLLAAEGCDHATFGLAPLAGTRSRLLRTIRRLGRPLYDFDGLLRFKQKLGPQQAHRVWIAWPRGEWCIGPLVDVLRAFAGGRLWGFGLRTLEHRAPDVARLLAWLLVPWITVLAVAPVERWFPSRTVQLLWIALDIVILVALWRLSLRWSRRLAGTLAFVAAVDFLFGSLQALTWNLRRTSLLVELFLVLCALIAPLAAAAFLWVARGSARARLHDRRVDASLCSRAP